MPFFDNPDYKLNDQEHIELLKLLNSNYKSGQVLDEIRGAKFEVALNYLHFSKAKAASQIEKTLRLHDLLAF